MEAQAPIEKKMYDVQVAGISVRLKSSHSEETVSRLTTYISDKIENAQKANPQSSFQNVLFLTCLQMAEELVFTKTELSSELNSIKSEALQLLGDLEASPLNQATLDV